MEDKLKPVWVKQDGHDALSEVKFRHKLKSMNQAAVYLARFERSVRRADKDLYEKLRFTLN
jgi:hypothetical protein